MKDKAVIFDMDGVIIDSEPAYLEMNLKMFSELGFEMDDEDYKALVGMPSLPMWTMLKKKYNFEKTVEEIIQSEKNRMFSILDSGIISKPMDGINSLLKELSSYNCKLSVASSSAKDNIEHILKKLNIYSFFEFIISGEEVAKGKPDPDIFLKVSERFSIHPNKCFVIEDSTNGVTAAKSAGMKCIGFKNNDSNHQDITNADMIIQNFEIENISVILDFIKNS
ncbi:MAG TPA: HAD family phosphatase [Ignavibacteria bacterium]|nr:HAD family phosphatase [Ignavibacteria bacterium]